MEYRNGYLVTQGYLLGKRDFKILKCLFTGIFSTYYVAFVKSSPHTEVDGLLSSDHPCPGVVILQGLDCWWEDFSALAVIIPGRCGLQ